MMLVSRQQGYTREKISEHQGKDFILLKDLFYCIIIYKNTSLSNNNKTTEIN